MADLKNTRVFGWLKTLGGIEAKGEIREYGERLFGPNNRNISASTTSGSTTIYASSSAVKTAMDKANAVESSLNTKVKTNVPAGAKFTDTLTTVRNNLTSTSSTEALSANQGKVLKGLIDNLNTILSSNDGSLNEIQEIVDYIKQNKSTLESLGISGIAGLQTALNGKLSTSGTAADSAKLNGQAGSYYAKASQVLTNVPAGAKFTDTQRALSSSISSTSTSVAATSSAVKTAYDRGTSALNTANGKLASNGKAVDSSKLNGLNEANLFRNQLTTVANLDTFFNRAGSASWTTSATGSPENYGTLLSFVSASGDYNGSSNWLTQIGLGTSGIMYTRNKVNGGGFTPWAKQWSSTNDGSGSGLDADLLDGQQGTYYAKASQVLTNVPKGAKFTDTNTHRGVHDGLTSSSTSVSLTANQGRILKGLIDNINALLTSNDKSLDQLQELVNFIKINRNTLNSLTIASIAGLQAALNGKLSTSGKSASTAKLVAHDTRAVNDTPAQRPDKALSFDFKNKTAVGNPPVSADNSFAYILTVAGWETSSSSGGWPSQLSIGRRGLAIREATSASAWSGWSTFWSNTNDGSGSGLDADLLDGQHGSYYAKASQVKTNVPAGAKFTDTNTWRSVSDSLTSTSTSASLSANQGRILKNLIDTASSNSATNGVYLITNAMSSPSYTWGYLDVVIENVATSNKTLAFNSNIAKARVGDRVTIRNVNDTVLTLTGIEILDSNNVSLGTSNTVTGKGLVSMYLNANKKLVVLSSVKK